LAEIDVILVERRENQDLVGSRAGGLHARSLEVLDQRGIVDRFLREGRTIQVNGFGGTTLDISDFPSRHPYSLGLWQRHIERILLGWVEELAVPILRGREVTGFVEDAEGVSVALSDGGSLRAAFLAGCDGGRSVVRKAAGIAFPGSDATVSHLIAEVELAEEAEWGMRYHHARGLHSIGKIEDGKVRVLVTEKEPGRTDEPTLSDLSRALVAVYGTDYGIHSPVSITRFTDMARQAEVYRKERILLAGDAAHVHYPAGGQGLNLGLQDAVNLGWKLAQVVSGTSSHALLDTYHAERHPVAARALRDTLAAVAVGRQDDRSNALRELVGELLTMEEPRKALGGRMSGLDIRYDLGEGHALVGRRMPDVDLMTDDGPVRVFELLRQARPVLIDLGGAGGLGIGARAARVRVVKARFAGVLELPVIGEVAVPRAVLVRPDGYVAWAGDGGQAGLEAALGRWFGA
jgi:2-polyprenyl-6-methoxyphenol hydroxylase-like FAD-dependent oxidoreductase